MKKRTANESCHACSLNAQHILCTSIHIRENYYTRDAHKRIKTFIVNIRDKWALIEAILTHASTRTHTVIDRSLTVVVNAIHLKLIAFWGKIFKCLDYHFGSSVTPADIISRDMHMNRQHCQRLVSKFLVVKNTCRTVAISAIWMSHQLHLIFRLFWIFSVFQRIISSCQFIELGQFRFCLGYLLESNLQWKCVHQKAEIKSYMQHQFTVFAKTVENSFLFAFAIREFHSPIFLTWCVQ